MSIDAIRQAIAAAGAALLLLTPAAGAEPFTGNGNAGITPPAAGASLTTLIHACDRAEGLGLAGHAKIEDGALRIDSHFSGRIDLNALGIDPKKHDLLKFEAKTPRGAFLRLSLENYPNDGELSHWYVFDGTRGPSDWKTVWVDLRLIEEIKAAGTYKGLAAEDPSLRGLQIMGHVVDSRRAMQEPGAAIWLRNLRAVNKAIDLDWDQRRFDCTRGDGKNLVYTYPVTVRNLLDRALTVDLGLIPFDAQSATAKFDVTTLELAPGETREVTATVTLPAAVASSAAPLYCERFEARASVREIGDADVTILRSADPIHLNVTVPIPEDRLAPPFYPNLTGLPEYVFGGWDEAMAREHAAALTPQNAESVVRDAVMQFGHPKGAVLDRALASSAFLYDFTGDRQFYEKLRAAFKAYAEVFSELEAADRRQPVRIVSHGLMATNVLQFNFKFGGAQRPPYYYSTNGNGKAGGLFGHLHAFDIIAAELPEDERAFIIENLFIPAAIQSRNHYFGLGNQQSNSNFVMLYAALVARHWPIAGFAYSAEHGLLNNIRWTFDDDGLCREGHYQEYTINPILHATEALYVRGIDLYDRRLYEIMHSKGAAAIGMDYRYDFVRYLDAQRFAGKSFVAELAAAETDGYHLKASTLLKWEDLEAAMNWGTHIMRGSHDRCALTVRTRQDARKTHTICGGGSYNHSSFGQSIIIVDEQLQHPVPGEVAGYDVDGPVQYVQCRSEEHYPGSVITRTFALLEEHVLVVDRVVSGQPRMVDWFLLHAGGETSLSLEQVDAPLTTKPGDNRIGVTFGGDVKPYRRATTSDAWSAMGGRLHVLGAPGTEVRLFNCGDRPSLIARRAGVKATDYVACLSSGLERIDPLAVTKAGGGAADAIGLRMVFADGRNCRAIVNYEPEGVEVVADGLRTIDRFATDYDAAK